MTSQRIVLPEVGDEANATLAGLLAQLDQHAVRNRMLNARYEAERAMRRAFNGIIP